MPNCLQVLQNHYGISLQISTSHSLLKEVLFKATMTDVVNLTYDNTDIP